MKGSKSNSSVPNRQDLLQRLAAIDEQIQITSTKKNSLSHSTTSATATSTTPVAVAGFTSRTKSVTQNVSPTPLVEISNQNSVRLKIQESNWQNEKMLNLEKKCMEQEATIKKLHERVEELERELDKKENTIKLLIDTKQLTTTTANNVNESSRKIKSRSKPKVEASPKRHTLNLTDLTAKSSPSLTNGVVLTNTSSHPVLNSPVEPEMNKVDSVTKAPELTETCNSSRKNLRPSSRKLDPVPVQSSQTLKTEAQEEIRSNLDNEWLLSYSDLQRVAKLGSGVSSTVYKGTWASKEVAIKILRLISPAKDLNDFKKELFIMSQVSDTNIVHFYGATLEPKLCIVMELCPNGSLYHYMVANEITWDNFFKWSCEMCSGINVLHRWKPTIVHRDLKSLNLLLNKDLTIKVCDFGLSRYVPPEGENPQECDQTLQKLRGTYAYTAPEMYHSKNYTTKSDVFSIGIIIWEMSSCVINRQFRKPYSEYTDIKHDYQIIYQVAEQGRRPTIPIDCPKAVAAVMQQCWAQEPADRPSVEELLVHMNEIKKRYKKKKSRWY